MIPRMRCRNCGHAGGPAALFCDQCGARVVRTCSTCGGTLAPLAVECAICGTADAQRPEWPDVGGAGDEAGERRHVTVMFCDVVESTALAHQMDLEEWRALVRGFQRRCFQEVSRAGGFVAQYLGDGVLAYFGYPVAHEQDAQAAVCAGLEIVRVHERPRGGGVTSPPIRVGIHSGLVLTGEMGIGQSRQLLAVGSVPHVAARVQNAARPNQIVVSEATHRLVRGFFQSRPLGDYTLRGVERTWPLYQIEGGTGVASRPEALLSSTLTPLVGRSLELATLIDWWEAVRSGRGHLVLVSGEAGVGKSRLVMELKARIARDGHVVAECRCAPHYESSALHPVIELLRRSWKLEGATSPEEQRGLIHLALAPLGAVASDAAPLVASLLTGPSGDAEVAADGPQSRKQKTLKALCDLLVAAATQQPMVLLVEDLHWVDPSTLQLLDLVVERVREAPVLVVLLFRPEFAPSWSLGQQMTRLQLSRLSPEETQTMIAGVAGGKVLPSQLRRELTEKTDGVPLYIEEMVRMVLESGALSERADRYEMARPLAELDIPATLQESLVARLDRLGALRVLVQLAAVIGRAFGFDLIAAVSGDEPASLKGKLARLVELDILRLDSEGSQDSYGFKHALILDAAYASLVRSKRCEYEARVAMILETRFVEVAEQNAELLGHHWAGAERPDLAIVYFLAAGRGASDRSALVEACRHLQRALSLVERVADAPARARLELEVCLALAPVLVAMRGYSNPEVERVYGRAHALCEGTGDLRLLYTVLSGLHTFHQSRGELSTCVALATRRLGLAEQLGDPLLRLHVLETSGTVSFWRGDHPSARRDLQQALAQYDPVLCQPLRMMYGIDSRAISAAYLGQSLFYLGEVDQARQSALAAVDHARALRHAHSQALTLMFAAVLHLQRGELAEAEARADEAIAVSAEQELGQWLGAGRLARGMVLVHSGRIDEGLASMLQGLQEFRGSGAKLGVRFFLAGLAQGQLRAGKISEALTSLRIADDEMGGCEDSFHDAELWRVRGAVLQAAGRSQQEVERCLEQALSVSRAQRARSLELRAATDLARWWQQRGRAAEARALLGPLLDRFSEGAGTYDVRNAATVLASL